MTIQPKGSMQLRRREVGWGEVGWGEAATYDRSRDFRTKVGQPGSGGIGYEEWSAPSGSTKYNLYSDVDGPGVREGVGRSGVPSTRTPSEATQAADPNTYGKAQGEIEVGHSGAQGFTHYEQGVEVGGQGTLFRHRSTHANSTVQLMEGTKAARVPLMGALGVAANDTMKTHGREMKPSDDLSPHSERLVDHLAKKGAIERPPEIVKNGLTFMSSYSTRIMGAQVPDSEVKAGWDTVKGVLGRPNRKLNGQQMSLLGDQ